MQLRTKVMLLKWRNLWNSLIRLGKIFQKAKQILLFRFAKLQDTIREKLFSELLIFFQEENIKNRPFLDILNRLEQLEILSNKDVWIELRKIQNDISHHYDDDSQEMALGINAIYLKIDMLIKIFKNVESQYQKVKLRI